jgi:hypothetical protein
MEHAAGEDRTALRSPAQRYVDSLAMLSSAMISQTLATISLYWRPARNDCAAADM